MADGHIMYQGPARESPAYFNSIGFHCPTFSNPADYYMKVLSITYPKNAQDEKKVNYLYSSYQEKLEESVLKVAAEIDVNPIDLTLTKKKTTGFF